jgi:hypothetical protein
MQTFYTSKGQRVDSQFDTDMDAVAALAGTTNDFARDLVSATIRGRLTVNQRPWLHKLAMDVVAPPPPPAPAVSGLMGIVSLFNHALAHLKRPKLTFDFGSNRRLRIAMAGARSRYAGDFMVTDGGPFGSNRYFGRIARATGDMIAGRDMEEWVAEALDALNTDPAEFAAQYGHESGACCFCNLTLTDERSTAVGYGPVCATHYGLPWGAKAKAA